MKMGKTLPYLKVLERRVGDRHIQWHFEVKHATTRVQQNFRSIIKKYLSKDPLMRGGNSNLGRAAGRRGKCKGSHDIRVCWVTAREEVPGGQPSG